MNNSNINELSAETEADSNSTAQNQQVSQPNANTNVVGSLFQSREIKFKYIFQHEETGRMCSIVFDYSQIFNGECKTQCERLTGYSIVAKCQFSNQKYNGIELYEDDIVEIEYHEEMIRDHPLNGFNPFGEDKQKPIIRLICDYGCDSSFHLKRIDDKSHACYSVQFGGSAVKSKKIIGNRFLNPELLQSVA